MINDLLSNWERLVTYWIYSMKMTDGRATTGMAQGVLQMVQVDAVSPVAV